MESRRSEAADRMSAPRRRGADILVCLEGSAIVSALHLFTTLHLSTDSPPINKLDLISSCQIAKVGTLDKVVARRQGWRDCHVLAAWACLLNTGQPGEIANFHAERPVCRLDRPHVFWLAHDPHPIQSQYAGDNRGESCLDFLRRLILRAGVFESKRFSRRSCWAVFAD